MWNGNGGPPILTDEQIRSVMKHIAEYGDPEERPRREALAAVLVNHGVRLSEALTMMRSQIDFPGERITFRTLKRHRRPCPDCRTRSGYRVHVRPELDACPQCGIPMPKAKPVYRTMPLSPHVAEALTRYLATHESERVFPMRPTQTCESTERIRTWRMFQKACKRAGVPPKKLHSLRASYITRVLRQTRDIKITQEAAGHASLATTSGYAFALDYEEKMSQIPPIT